MFGRRKEKLSRKELEQMMSQMSKRDAKKLRKAIDEQKEEEMLDMLAFLECFMDD